jgi:catechol 2,3-dioxygenase-like lactoylglutathione lyase family enzyme
MIGAIHHLDLNVSDLERSSSFYDRILTRIGFIRVNLSTPDEPGGFDWISLGDNRTRLSIGIYQATGPNKSHDRYAPGIHHLALRACRREDVDELYRMLLEMKAEILNAPCEYPQYEAGYYAVFFLDPDGIKVEYVYTPDLNN